MATLRIEVVYALPEGADAVNLRLAPGATVADAVRASGLLERHPGLLQSRMGIYGKAAGANTRLADGDRVEIYRPLAMDPKEARRRRALRNR